ncbi:hypothetical protein [Alteribacillus sp. YIM 98480]|uniref:hypothetical protein n=1 Tax=Alteribacillus sp. YIM 98480 TaxID=2606599 RepID=UPI00131C2C71|nr:hypothetical protein [Alteribacillus sp. YIM 98480]
MRIKSVYSFLFGVAILLSGCGVLETSNRSEDPFPPPIPTGTVEMNNTQHGMKSGGYEWIQTNDDGDSQAVQTDAPSPMQIADIMEAIALKPETEAEITFNSEHKPQLTLYIWNEDGRNTEGSLKDHSFTLPEKTGEYVYEVVADWSYENVKGTVSYTFLTEVE